MHIQNIQKLSMKTVSIFKNGNNCAIRQPRIWVSRGESVREGNCIILRPVGLT